MEPVKTSLKKTIRQIAGELQGSVKAVQYALNTGNKKVVIFHDYEGISHHATGFWERREKSSIEYYNKMNELMNKGIEVMFVKRGQSHGGIYLMNLLMKNDKEKLSIQSDRTVGKWLLSKIK